MYVISVVVVLIGFQGEWWKRNNCAWGREQNIALKSKARTRAVHPICSQSRKGGSRGTGLRGSVVENAVFKFANLLW